MGEQSITNLFESQTIFADHKDLIHDVAYDFYGERMATCSSDQYVKVGYLCKQSFFGDNIRINKMLQPLSYILLSISLNFTNVRIVYLLHSDVYHFCCLGFIISL